MSMSGKVFAGGMRGAVAGGPLNGRVGMACGGGGFIGCVPIWTVVACGGGGFIGCVAILDLGMVGAVVVGAGVKSARGGGGERILMGGALAG